MVIKLKMKEMLYPFADTYFFHGVIVGSMFVLIILTIIISLIVRWTLINVLALIAFVFLFSIALIQSSKMYKEKQ